MWNIYCRRTTYFSDDVMAELPVLPAYVHAALTGGWDDSFISDEYTKECSGVKPSYLYSEVSCNKDTRRCRFDKGLA